jgi:hypothetical protein
MMSWIAFGKVLVLLVANHVSTMRVPLKALLFMTLVAEHYDHNRGVGVRAIDATKQNQNVNREKVF